jgi:XRE family transcriptional regulator, aerobic/anaerobic benzoate catabolism transcriptional regulator
LLDDGSRFSNILLLMTDPLLARLGAAVGRLRTAQDLSVDEVARRSGLSARFLGEIAAGRGNVSIVRLAKLARALGTTAAAMVAEAEAETRPPPCLVALLGVRGAGKSTIGPKLAARLGMPFIELDHRVEEEAGLSLSEIFATHGETYFRRLEVDALRHLVAAGTSAVVATGGGIVENAEAWAILEGAAVTVWLRAGTDAHWNRVVRQGDPRPMAGRPAARAELDRLLRARARLYRRARHTVDTERLGVAGSVRRIADLARGQRRRRAGRR